jgi:hypothetical protein
MTMSSSNRRGASTQSGPSTGAKRTPRRRRGSMPRRESATGTGNVNFAAFLTDLEELLTIVKGSAQSKLYLVVTPDIAKAVATQALGVGISVANWARFELCGVNVWASDAQSSQKMTLIDSSQVAMRLGEVMLRTSTEGNVEMDTAPSGTSATSVSAVSTVSLFQTNSVAYLAERSATIEAITDYACASMTGVLLGDDGGSPN